MSKCSTFCRSSRENKQQRVCMAILRTIMMILQGDGIYTNLTQSAECPVEVQRWRPCWRESQGRESGGLGPLLFQDGSHHLIGFLSGSFATLTFPDVSLCSNDKCFTLINWLPLIDLVLSLLSAGVARDVEY